VRTGWLVIALLGAACSGDSASVGPLDAGTADLVGAGLAACSATLSPCGGDLVGSWSFVAWCGPGTGVPGCPDAAYDLVTAGLGVTFAADGTYAITAGGGDDYEVFPPGCLGGDGGVGLSCEQLSSPSAPCTANSSGTCRCNVGPFAPIASSSGTYSVKDTTLTTVPSGGGGASPFGYCVSGQVLHWKNGSTTFVLTRG
jgi:hypothetical protein